MTIAKASVGSMGLELWRSLRGTWLSLVCLWMTACSQQPRPYPLALLPSAGPLCPAVDQRAISPDQFDGDRLEKRLSRQRDSIVWPIDIDCISQRYSKSQLEYWSRRQDVIAAYASMYNQYRTKRSICRKLGPITSQLEQLASRSSKFQAPGISARLPELWFLSGKVKIMCGGSSAFVSVSYSRGKGFDPLPLLGIYGVI